CTSFFALSFFSYWSAAHRALPSFPTRRSSDLHPRHAVRLGARRGHEHVAHGQERPRFHGARARGARAPHRDHLGPGGGAAHLPRSEEHTSELQSRENLVCRLLLEKKKKKEADM